MKLDKTGLLMVAGAALALYLVVKKSTGAAVGAPAGSGQAAIGSNAASFWSNAINNLSGSPVVPTFKTSLGPQLPGGVTLFGNGTFDASGMYVDPGQITYNTQTGQVQESPFSGMYNIIPNATYGL
ncbi:hypothetical protein [Paraburkholderia kururiensis]|uniref:hypothetical protein n=1 Tax=Paraburkholderia kururiensis TaxID=984307 RepID=UPI0005A9B206|nr:hypothetical protein [Paraburkholderia kururiensis]